MNLPILVVTTAVSPPLELAERAECLAQELCVRYASRRNITIAALFRETRAERLLIVERNRLLLRSADEIEYFFHPNLALVRGLNIMRGTRDIFAEATGLSPGERLLDCTLGFASEATLAAMLVGPSGTVVGLESVPELAAVTRAGAAQFSLQTKHVEEALRRVQVVTADYREYLPLCTTNAYDVVYFDPFFGERLPGSAQSVSPLAYFGNTAPLDSTALHEACRVASQHVVVKHPKHEPLPADLAATVAETVTTRKSLVQYDIFAPI